MQRFLGRYGWEKITFLDNSSETITTQYLLTALKTMGQLWSPGHLSSTFLLASKDLSSFHASQSTSISANESRSSTSASGDFISK
jgi:hypothetical protein